MDVRWSRLLAGSFLCAAVGCMGTNVRQPSLPTSLPPSPMAQGAQPTQPPRATQVASAPEPKPGTKLKPSTIVTMGALKEQAADDKDRSPAEAEQYRYQARMEYLRAIQMDPKFGSAYMALAHSYVSTNERDKALATFKRAAAANPTDGTVWFEQGAALARWKEWPAAVESLQQAVKLDPENKMYAKTLGLTLARAGRYDDAYATLAKCLSEAEARTNIARMLKHVQQPELSRKQTELALKANPDYGPARELMNELTGVTQATVREAAPTPPPTLPASVASQAQPVAKPTAGSRVKPVLLDQPIAPVRVGSES
ncbi:MAG: tetratricopeptide repeat protein [Gemmataceae bacterium]